jgi:hypothetical protein
MKLVPLVEYVYPVIVSEVGTDAVQLSVSVAFPAVHVKPEGAVRVALATGIDTTDRNPAVSAVAATTAMRCLIVLLDIYFLSLARIGTSYLAVRMKNIYMTVRTKVT